MNRRSTSAARDTPARAHRRTRRSKAGRPTDTVVMQKTLFEVFKQNQGEYMGTILSSWLESMLPAVMNEDQLTLGEDTFDKGLNNAVKDNDALYPPEWRLSYAGRKAKS